MPQAILAVLLTSKFNHMCDILKSSSDARGLKVAEPLVATGVFKLQPEKCFGVCKNVFCLLFRDVRINMQV